MALREYVADFLRRHPVEIAATAITTMAGTAIGVYAGHPVAGVLAGAAMPRAARYFWYFCEVMGDADNDLDAGW